MHYIFLVMQAKAAGMAKTLAEPDTHQFHRTMLEVLPIIEAARVNRNFAVHHHIHSSTYNDSVVFGYVNLQLRRNVVREDGSLGNTVWAYHTTIHSRAI